MTTTINAKSTGIGGLDVTCDASGSLGLQTGGVTAVTINTSQNVGIGTTSPSYKLDAVSATNAIAKFTYSTVSSVMYNSTGSGTAYWGDTNVQNAFGINSGSAYVSAWTNNVERMRIDSSGTLIVGDTVQSGSSKLTLKQSVDATNGGLAFVATDGNGAVISRLTDGGFTFRNGGLERMRITANGDLCIGKTAENDTTAGMRFTGTTNSQYTSLVRDGAPPLYINRLTNDGDLVQFAQANTVEGTISVSGTTVSYNGGHLSRWSQWQNETGQPSVYRGTVLESVDAMCEWEKDGEPLPNEQATKTIVSTTVASKAVAGVFDRYDEDDETNPYDFYVAQSGDFVIRIAQGVVVQNGDLLESAGDGTAKPQADDICRSSTVAKVTSNYVSATYEDGSYCVPCILMIG